jgi:hypothetical protein
MRKWEGIVESIKFVKFFQIFIFLVPIKLFPPKNIYPNHNGWGLEDSISCLELFSFLGKPEVAKLEYSWNTELKVTFMPCHL